MARMIHYPCEPYNSKIQKARRTLQLLAELATSRAHLFSRLLQCAVNFCENLALRGREEKFIVFDFFASQGKILNKCGRCELLA